MGKINDKLENITSEWFFLRCFQHDISMVLRNKETISFQTLCIHIYMYIYMYIYIYAYIYIYIYAHTLRKMLLDLT